MADPIAQGLASSAALARLGYIDPHGFPKVMPVGFHWADGEFIICTATSASKVPALQSNARAALTIDSADQPLHVLMVRGFATVAIVSGIPDEFLASYRKLVPPTTWPAFEQGIRTTYQEMARITLLPEEVTILDFDLRTPRFPTEQSASD